MNIDVLPEKYPFLPLINGIYIGDITISKKMFREKKRIILPVNIEMFEEIMDVIPAEQRFSDSSLLDLGIENLVWGLF